MPPGTLSERLRGTREERGLSIEALGARAGVGRDAVAHIEYGRTRNPRVATLLALASALDVSPSWLLNGCADRGIDRLIVVANSRSARARAGG